MLPLGERVSGRGWTVASDLRPGDSLRGPDGSLRTVAAPLDRHEAKPRTVYDLTVSGLHTFYAVAGGTPVLVHNCNDIVLDGQKFPSRRRRRCPPKRRAATGARKRRTACGSTRRRHRRSSTTR
ncbi:hypothetical protein [Streptomyces sp. NPDC048277]|uniref:hypothetical protein n=1 Tax=Streptomyces sp. NPDC048277 TaxID=3155027 RepID=UPI0033D26733